MTATTILINGYDLKQLGFSVRTSPHTEPPEKKWLTDQIPGRAGAVLLSPTPQVDGRVLTIPGALVATSLATFRSNFDKLKYKLDFEPLAIVLADDQTRQVNGRLSRITISPQPARQFLIPAVEMDLEFLCERPYLETVSQSSVAFNTATAMPLGTALVRPLIRLAASGSTMSNPVVTYKDSGGATKGTLDLTGANILAGDKIEIDCEALTIIKTVSGVASDASNLLVGGDFFALDPRHGDFLTSTWPTLQKSNTGAGTLTATALFNKRWL